MTDNLNQFQRGEVSFSSFSSNERGEVPYFVYLPPNWTTEKEYPLVLFFHGQGGDEGTFNKYVDAEQLNEWISQSLIEPIVILGVRGDDDKDNVQWFTPENEKMIMNQEEGELISYCQNHFRAGFKQNIALYGHSRGAAGAIHFYLKYSGNFSSVIAMGYVSDYTLKKNQKYALDNLEELKRKKIPLRLEIGTEDTFVVDKKRKCCFQLHDFFEEVGIEHQFEHLHGVAHRFDYFWNYITEEGIENGLRHLQFFDRTWKKNR